MAYDFNSLTKQAPEATNRDKFYTDFGDVDPSKLHQISELTEWMRTKAKGSDVREVIAQLFERTWVESIKEGNANLEVAKARGVFETLSDRLTGMDKIEAKNTNELTSLIANALASIGDGSPKAVFANVNELQSSYPTGSKGIYITSDNGHWWYWDNSKWADGGQYQSAVVNREVESLLSNTISLNIPITQNTNVTKTIDINLKKGEALSVFISSESVAANSQIVLGYNSILGKYVQGAAYFMLDNKEVFYAPEDIKSLVVYIEGASITTNGTASIALSKESIVDAFSEKLDDSREINNYISVYQGRQLLNEIVAILPEGTEIEIWSKNYSEFLNGDGDVGIRDELGQQINSVSNLTNKPKTLILDRNIKKLVFYVKPDFIAKSGMLNICYRVIGKEERLERELQKLRNQTRNYHGKTIGIIGDSYSTFENWVPAGNAVYYTGDNNTKTGVTSVDKTWWHLLITRLGASLLRNDSWSGATISGTGYSGQDATNFSFVTRGNRSFGESKILEQKPDIIFILGGLNDTWANSPVGDVKFSNFNQSDLKQTLPSTSKLVSDLKNYNPGCQIVLIAPYQVKSEIKNGMRTICDYYKATFVELPEVAIFDGHPTDRGMQQIADYIYDNIINL